MKKYRINEIFYSIQGEGYHTGTPAVFIRFAGCNLTCDFCDTKHEIGHLHLSASDILAIIKQYESPIVILTGGEPLLQADFELVKALKRGGRKVHVETNGTVGIGLDSKMQFANLDWITVSPKNGDIKIKKAHELKIVFDGDVQKVLHYEMDIQAKHKYLQPMSGENIHETIQFIKENPQWKLSTQMHKLLNVQ